jgi:predicted nucleotidyltransferase
MPVTSEFLTFVPRFSEWAASKRRIRRAWVYGSRLRGTQASDSDIDLALEIDQLETDEETLADWMFESSEWQKELQALVPFKVQLEWYGGEGTPKITQYIACCSMLVFERVS